MTAKKTASKKSSSKSAKTEASPVGDTEEEMPTLPGRLLKTGSTVFLPGSKTPLTLGLDTNVTGEGIEKDKKWVGMLARDENNFELNIVEVEGTWSPVTCQREE